MKQQQSPISQKVPFCLQFWNAWNVKCGRLHKVFLLWFSEKRKKCYVEAPPWVSQHTSPQQRNKFLSQLVLSNKFGNMTSLFAHGIFKSFLRLFHHACGFLFNFSKVTENANNDKTIDFFPRLQWYCYRVWKFTITKLKYHRLLCYTTDINL